MVQVKECRFGNNYADNIIDPDYTFDEVQTWSVTSGIGLCNTDTNYAFNGLMSLKIENTAPTADIVVANTSLSTTFNRKLDDCQLSFYLYKDDASYEYTGEVKIFKNAVLLDTQTFTLEDSQDEDWYRFVTDDVYSFATTDVITMTFQLDAIAGHGGTSKLWIDGIMLNVTNDRLNFAPPMYTLPNTNGSLPALPTSDGTYILEVDSGSYSWTDYRNYSGWADYMDDEYTSGSPLSLAATTTAILSNNAATIVQSQMPTDINEMYYSGGFVLSGVSGTFEVDETITGGTSGATATLRLIDGGDYYFLDNSATPFQVAETITGGTSGATGTVASLLDPIITGKNGDSYIITLDFKAKPTNAGTSYIETWFDIGGSVGELYRRINTFPKGNGVERAITHSTGVYTLNTWEGNGAKVYVEADNTCDIYDIRFVIIRLHRAR